MRYAATVFLMSSAISLMSASARASTGLQGDWQCRGGAEGEVSLSFKSGNELDYNGRSLKYALVKDNIRVVVDNAPMDYRYTLKGDSLSIVFPDNGPDNGVLKCKRQRGAFDKEARLVKQAERLLKGAFCSYSSSYGGGAGYSSSNRAWFDGNGRFSYGVESSFSGSAGQGYSQGSGNTGAYRVLGDKVVLKFNDGTTSTAAVHFRLTDGTITEVMYDGKLYGQGLCQ